MTRWWENRLWQLLTNRTLSTLLLIGVTLTLIIGVLLPNPSYLGPEQLADMQLRHPLLLRLGANFNNQKMATGYLLGGTGIYLIVSAALCSLDRLRGRLKFKTVATGPDPELMVGNELVMLRQLPVTPTDAAAFAATWLRRRLPSADISSEGSLVVARRGRYGFWGSIMFHSLLITALVGMVVFYLGGTRGWLSFTEGQEYWLEKSHLRHIEKEPVWGIRLPDVKLTLLRQYSRFAAEDTQTATEHVASFRVTERNGTSFDRDLRINQPMTIAGKDFILMFGGFAPHFVISGKSDEKLLDSFVNLREDGGTRDDFTVAGGLQQVKVRFFPDFKFEQGAPVNKGLEPLNPVMEVTVKSFAAEPEQHFVPVGQPVRFAGCTILVPEVRRWVELEVVNEPGIGFFFAISFLGVIGLTIRLLDPDELLVVCFTVEYGQTNVSITASSRHFQALLAGIANDCAEAVKFWAMNKGHKG